MNDIPWFMKKDKEKEPTYEFLARLKAVEEKIEEVGHRWCWLCWKDCGTQEKRDKHMRKAHGIGADEKDDRQKKLFM